MTKKTFGKFKDQLSSGNKEYHVYHSGDVGNKTVNHYAKVKAYNRDEAHTSASKIFKTRHPDVKNVSVDHIGTEKLSESTIPDNKKFRWEITFSMAMGAGRMADSKIVNKVWIAYTEQEAKEKAHEWLKTQDQHGKILDIEKSPHQYDYKDRT